MRVPWIGWVAIQVQNAGINNNYAITALIIVLLVLLIVVEFIAPLLQRKLQKNTTQPSTPSPTDASNLPINLQCLCQT
jgi:biopolymer transport protein ExbD